MAATHAITAEKVERPIIQNRENSPYDAFWTLALFTLMDKTKRGEACVTQKHGKCTFHTHTCMHTQMRTYMHTYIHKVYTHHILHTNTVLLG
jgi:hypothetical protein